MSDHKTLAEALVAFQAEAPKLLKGNTAKITSPKGSYTYKYISLDDVMEAIQPLLAKHGLAWSAYPTFGPKGEPALRYKLTHSSGDFESDTMPLLVQKEDPQGLGSGITYARRYALLSVLNLVADEDDDGQKASAPSRVAPSRVYDAPGAGSLTVTADLVPDHVAFIKAAAQGLTARQIRGCLQSLGMDPTHLDTDPPFRRVEKDKSGALIAALKGIVR